MSTFTRARYARTVQCTELAIHKCGVYLLVVKKVCWMNPRRPDSWLVQAIWDARTRTRLKDGGETRIDPDTRFITLKRAREILGRKDIL